MQRGLNFAKYSEFQKEATKVKLLLRWYILLTAEAMRIYHSSLPFYAIEVTAKAKVWIKCENTFLLNYLKRFFIYFAEWLNGQLSLWANKRCMKSARIWRYSGPNAEKVDQNNSEYGCFLRSEICKVY